MCLWVWLVWQLVQCLSWKWRPKCAASCSTLFGKSYLKMGLILSFFQQWDFEPLMAVFALLASSSPNFHNNFSRGKGGSIFLIVIHLLWCSLAIVWINVSHQPKMLFLRKAAWLIFKLSQRVCVNTMLGKEQNVGSITEHIAQSIFPGCNKY